MTPVIPHGLTPTTQEHSLQSYALPIQSRKMPEPNGVNSVWTISSTIDCPSIIATQLMKVMTPFLIFPTMTSMTTCHQISFSKKMNKPILHLNSASERDGGSDEETDSSPERDVGFDEETDSASESADGSGVGTSGSVSDGSGIGASGSVSGSVDPNPGPAIPPNDETAFSSTPQFPKDQANLVKLELAMGHQGKLYSCGHIFKPDDCPHYKTYLKNLTKRLELESLSHTMEDVLVPWGGRVKFPVFEFRAMF